MCLWMIVLGWFVSMVWCGLRLLFGIVRLGVSVTRTFGGFVVVSFAVFCFWIVHNSVDLGSVEGSFVFNCEL